MMNRDMTASVAQLVEHYQQILSDRMQGLPFVNVALDVAAVGFREFDEHFVGVLITPWFMNLVLLPGSDDWSDQEQGSFSKVRMPGEEIEFNVCRDDVVGTYLTAVLFRTVSEFPDQDTAQKVAEDVVERLFTTVEKPAAKAVPRLSRREFFSRLGTG